MTSKAPKTTEDTFAENLEQTQESAQRPTVVPRSDLTKVHELANRLMSELEKVPDGDMVGEIVETALKLLRDQTNRADVKLINKSLKELRYAMKVFAPYREVRKVSIFGSARTPETHEDYKAAAKFGKRMANEGWMVITGAGGGIMAAGHGGAGAEPSFGLAIRLPFEQSTNVHIANDPKLINFKDSMNVAGVRTTGGYTGFTAENGGVDMIPLADAPIVARLRDAGAIILGKTNLPRFARSGASANTSYLGPTYNAFNPTRVPGGSSSGTATAVSASFAAIGTAEETGGSIQNPAGAQALVGVKTTFGLVPTSGGIPLNGATRDVFGPNAKSVKDAARMLNVIAGADPSDPNSASSTVASGHIPAAGYLAGLSTTSLNGKRFGLFSPAFKNVTLSSDVNTLYTTAVNKLTSLGATVISDPFSDPALATPFNTIAATFSQYSGSNEPYDIQQWFKTMDPSKSPTSVQAFKAQTGLDLMAANGALLGSFAATAPNTDAGPGLAAAAADPDTNQTAFVDKFMQGRAIMLAAFRKVMDDYDLDGFFFPEQAAQPGLLPSGTATGNYSNTTVSEINLLGTPQVNLPGGYYADGTPFSVAFLGDTFSEASLLNYAYAYEQATLFRTAPVLVPEPGTFALIGVVIIPLLTRRRRAA